MRTLALQQLLDSLARPVLVPRANARVAVAEEPVPFIAPTLSTKHVTIDIEPFGAEVILISAPAAVGKSTVARYISSRARVPLLNLATTPVSTHSLVGILQADFEGEGSALAAFHNARLPVIVDSLDEGRLLTGEKGFEQFLLTTAELLLRDRSVTNRPKLIFLGRSGSSAFAALALSYFGEHFVNELEIEFFDEPDARLAIESYADNYALQKPKLREIEPAQRVVDAYFHAIERALSLPSTTLWNDPVGRAFAGYAPVLATLGEALARETNYQVLENRLRQTSSAQGDAWGVLSEVVDQMLAREGAQLRSKFPPAAQSVLPDRVYDANEQLSFLARWIARMPVRGTGSHPLAGDLAETYYSLAEQKLPEHPFVEAEHQTPRNAVFAAVILAHAIATGLNLATGNSLVFFEEAARQPFLWRFFEKALGRPLLVEGEFLGYLLASMWSDPLATTAGVAVRGETSDGALVTIEGTTSKSFEATTPIVLYSLARGVDGRVQGELRLRGASAHRGRSMFSLTGRNVLRADTLMIESDEVVVDGYSWIAAAELLQGSRLQLQVKPGAQYGWGGVVTNSYPWSAYKAVVTEPDVPGAESDLVRIIKAFIRHVGALPRPFYVGLNYGALDAFEYGERATWMARDFGVELPRFVRALVEHDLASVEAVSGQREKRLKVSIKCSWTELLAAATEPQSASPQLRSFVLGANSALR
jgi:hypothetical protein